MMTAVVNEKEHFYTPEEDLKRLQETDIMERPDLPYVLIIGDSISIGYTPFVKIKLEGVANVIKIPGNGGSSANCLKFLKETPEKWLGEKKYDVIHFNAGLWDIAYRKPNLPPAGNLDKVNGVKTSNPEVYRANLSGIVDILKSTGAKLVWASTTIVPENEPGRFSGDEIEFNEIAAQLMKVNNIEINDLHSVTRNFDLSLFKEPGNVHFTGEGYMILGEKVAEKIKTVLGR